MSNPDLSSLAIANAHLSRPGVRILAQYLHKMSRLEGQPSLPLSPAIVNIAVNMLESPTMRATLSDVVDLAIDQES